MIERRRSRLQRAFDYERADLTALALRAAEGDPAAEEVFIRRTMPDVWRFCAHLVGPDAADDAVQATYVRALKSLRSFRGESSAKTWLLGVARHVCLDQMRSQGRRRRLVDRIKAQPHEEVAADRPPAEREHLVEAIDGIDPDRREAFVLTQLLGYSYEEAAAVIGCPIGTIRSRVARARRDLLEHLGDAAEGPPGLRVVPDVTAASGN